MRSALICVLFIIIAHKECYAVSYEDFKPTPIPLREWGSDRRQEKAGTLHEVIATNATSAVAAIPPHYWEDALRHSVYLTLVRDKIDQLIAKGTVISPGAKPELAAPKEIDDHNLWEKIKNAPFDRLKPEEGAPMGDITIMARGRLIEDNEGYRFMEDEKSKEKCTDQGCMEGVKAFWSVKRARQRDSETIPGKYHYELTFSVTSHLEKQNTKPYENPVRTFTVRESKSAEGYPSRTPEPVIYKQRPNRAVWVHKNIHQGHSDQYQHRKAYNSFGLDKLFFSLFSDDDEPDEDIAPKYRPKPPPYSYNNGYVPNPMDYNVKNPPPNSHRYQPPKYSRPPHMHQYTQQYPHSMPPVSPPVAPPVVPPITPPSQPPLSSPPHQIHNYRYPENEPFSYKHHHNEYKYQSTNQIKSTKPVLPTPITFANLNLTMELPTATNSSDITTREPEIITYKMFTKPTMSKVNYFQDHYRPPVYTAPPGVFTTMDKKPFKPMPPIKMTHFTKHHKHKAPIDFRPSPQVMDIQFSDPDSLSDTFRPISINSAESHTTEFSVPHGKVKNNTRLKPLKKHEGVKSHRSTTTNAPDIITAHDLSMEQISLDTMQWANNILGAFSKTNPATSVSTNMYSEVNEPELTTAVTTTQEITVSTPGATEEQPIITTPISKRTRPPHKFGKPTKIRKVKRVTTTTTTTTETPSSSESLTDLSPQASTGHTKPTYEQRTRSTSTTSETPTTEGTTTTRSTTTRPTTTKPSTTSTTTESSRTVTQANSRNRFRQSTLMIKGTSVKHDKWNSPANGDRNRSTILSPKHTNRRKASNFQGYVSSTAKSVEDEHRGEHADVIPDVEVIGLKSTTETVDTKVESNADSESNIPDEFPDDGVDIMVDDLEESKDKGEYIFNVSSYDVNDHQNIGDTDVTVTESTVTSSTPKNKKCKKKQVKNEAINDEKTAVNLSDNTVDVTTKNASKNVTDKFTQTEPIQESSNIHENMSEFDLEVQKFLESINKNTGPEPYEPENEADEDEDDYFTEQNRSRKENDEYDDFHERQYSFLDLMMES